MYVRVFWGGGVGHFLKSPEMSKARREGIPCATVPEQPHRAQGHGLGSRRAPQGVQFRVLQGAG